MFIPCVQVYTASKRGIVASPNSAASVCMWSARSFLKIKQGWGLNVAVLHLVNKAHLR